MCTWLNSDVKGVFRNEYTRMGAREMNTRECVRETEEKRERKGECVVACACVCVCMCVDFRACSRTLEWWHGALVLVK